MFVHCDECDLLKEQYIGAVRVYGELLSEAVSIRVLNPEDVRRRTADAFHICKVTLQMYMDHGEEHGCVSQELVAV